MHPLGGVPLRTPMLSSGPSTTLSLCNTLEVTLFPVAHRTSTGVTLQHLPEPQSQLMKQESRHLGLIPKPMVLATSQRKRKCGLEKNPEQQNLCQSSVGSKEPTDVVQMAQQKVTDGQVPGKCNLSSQSSCMTCQMGEILPLRKQRSG